ncbi:Capsular polysaccharide biosynthesis protein [Microbacterium sp. cf046]|uniref:hypothetical protein n=1 Tax=Microbacterium sp. cf046 TaxID=1761803 RepID=UPI0008E0D02D|nr:hypothetical protein [Microbacterium sp. cf046]SFR88507.1 Capsular polysaccharide biosynthesis protein [Microbacterium sp. cf046]
MEIPKYLQILWNSKWLLLIGILVAATAGFFAGFKIEGGEVVPRAEQTYNSSTTVMISSQTQPLYQAVIPGQPLVEGQTQPTDVDLTSKAIIYAYLVSGADMRSSVEDAVGQLDDTEALTALRRTTQPGGDEAFPGRYSLPIIEVVGTSTIPDRAEAIATTATDSFLTQVVADQDEQQIPPTDRVVLTVINTTPPKAVEGSNPMIPVVVAFLGVFFLFVAAAFIIAGAKSSRAKKKAAKGDEPEATVTEDSDTADDEAPEELVTRTRRAKRSDSEATVDEDSEEREPAPVG